jgi:hypothetical protein
MTLARSALLCASGVLLIALAAPVRAQEPGKVQASTAMYVRTDTDKTTVLTPRLELGAPVTEETRIDLVYTVDVWTSASIDIRTSASVRTGDIEPKKVTEQRDEIDVGLEHTLGDAILGGSYRYSVEHDYESHGGSLGGSLDIADKSANVALALRAYFDTVGRAGAPDFEEKSTLFSARLAFTQVIDQETLVQLVYEPGLQQGYLSSPYRFVRFAAADGPLVSTCRGPVTLCLPEANPDSRLRHAIALSGRRALGEALSFGASYRFYLDDWDMTSHTVSLDGALMPSDDWLFALGYRFYRQSSASHFKSFYVSAPMKPLEESFTSDKELSELSSHRVSLEVMKTFQLDELGSELSTVLLVAPTYFLYHEFLLLDSITALEVTFAVEVAL